MRRDNVSFKNWNLLGVEKTSSHAHNSGSLYLFGVLFKISDGYPRFFHVGVFPRSYPRKLLFTSLVVLFFPAVLPPIPPIPPTTIPTGKEDHTNGERKEVG